MQGRPATAARWPSVAAQSSAVRSERRGSPQRLCGRAAVRAGEAVCASFGSPLWVSGIAPAAGGREAGRQGAGHPPAAGTPPPRRTRLLLGNERRRGRSPHAVGVHADPRDSYAAGLRCPPAAPPATALKSSTSRLRGVGLTSCTRRCAASASGAAGTCSGWRAARARTTGRRRPRRERRSAGRRCCRRRRRRRGSMPPSRMPSSSSPATRRGVGQPGLTIGFRTSSLVARSTVNGLWLAGRMSAAGESDEAAPAAPPPVDPFGLAYPSQ